MKILKFLKGLFQRFKNNSTDGNLIINQGAIDLIAPSVHVRLDYNIDDNENIARFIFSPINVNPKSNTLKNNCFKPPNNLDEVSVNRYSHTDADFLKGIGLKMQRDKKEFYGLALFKSYTIRRNDFDILYTPVEPPNDPVNMFHSDVKIGFKVVPGEELPPEISEKIKKVLKKTILYKDTDVSTPIWVGETIDFESKCDDI